MSGKGIWSVEHRDELFAGIKTDFLTALGVSHVMEADRGLVVVVAVDHSEELEVVTNLAVKRFLAAEKDNFVVEKSVISLNVFAINLSNEITGKVLNNIGEVELSLLLGLMEVVESHVALELADIVHNDLSGIATLV